MLLKKIIKPQLFILSGPSGVGKNAILRELLKVTPNLKKVITYTTRKRRLKEKKGKDHYFVTVENFKKMIEQGEFLEWAYVHRDYYGTPLEEIKNNIKKKLIMEIDVQGALQIKKKIPQAILIFIKPDSFKNLLRRIKKRGPMTKADLVARLKSYQKEIKLSRFYDYIIVNRENRLNETVAKIRKIIKGNS